MQIIWKTSFTKIKVTYGGQDQINAKVKSRSKNLLLTGDLSTVQNAITLQDVQLDPIFSFTEKLCVLVKDMQKLYYNSTK